MPTQSPKLTVFAAAKFEVEPIVAALKDSDVELELFIVGIGALAAASTISKAGAKTANRHVLFIGTCGAFETHGTANLFTAPTLVTASEVLWLPTCERVGLSYPVPNTNPKIATTTIGPLAFGLPQKSVICSPNISLTSKLPDSIDAACSVENLELYSCIGALQENSSSVSIILATTNSVGVDAHAQWKKNFVAAAQLTAAHVKEQLWRLK